MATATSARSSRSRSSNRCEINVPSASFSGSSLIGAACWRGPRRVRIGAAFVVGEGLGGHLGRAAASLRLGWLRGGHRLDRLRRGGALCLARLLELDFLLELLAELARHGSGSSHPT